MRQSRQVACVRTRCHRIILGLLIIPGHEPRVADHERHVEWHCLGCRQHHDAKESVGNAVESSEA